jgi:hypothetical protein
MTIPVKVYVAPTERSNSPEIIKMPTPRAITPKVGMALNMTEILDGLR